MTLQDEYDEVTAKWIEHESIREDVLEMLFWWSDRDKKLRDEVAELAAEVYRSRE